MSWLRIDDGFSRHPKVTALTMRQRWIWIDLLCYCARYNTNGYLPHNIREHVAGCTDRFLAECERLELVDHDGDYRIHDWQTYSPKDPTAAKRQAAWRRRHRNGEVTEKVTEKVTAKSSTSRAGTARVPVPSCPKEELRAVGKLATSQPIPQIIDESLADAARANLILKGLA